MVPKCFERAFDDNDNKDDFETRAESNFLNC